MKVILKKIRMIGFLVAAAILWQANSAPAQNIAGALATSGENEAEIQQAAPLAGATQGTNINSPEQKELTTQEILDAATHAAPANDSTYTLGINDVLEVTVARHPEVSGQFMINNEGNIQYNFVGDIEINGKTKEEVKGLIVTSLTKYVVNPDVTVKIVGYNSKVVYVIGEVGRPGKIFMRGDTITVREALLEAGLPLLSASTRKTRLVTPAENGKASTKYVNVEALLYEGDLNENLVMNPGDTLDIPATILAKAMRVIQPVSQPISEAAGTARTAYPAYGF